MIFTQKKWLQDSVLKSSGNKAIIKIKGRSIPRIFSPGNQRVSPRNMAKILFIRKHGEHLNTLVKEVVIIEF